MLSVTDNSQRARGDVSGVAAPSSNSEVNLDHFDRKLQPWKSPQIHRSKP
jgi:hypothetical protein